MQAALRQRIGARELKTRLGGYLRAVQRGVTILVTERGEPVAELRPVPRGARDLASRLDEAAALGIVTKGSGKPLVPFDPLVVRGRSLGQTIAEAREDRLR